MGLEFLTITAVLIRQNLEQIDAILYPITQDCRIMPAVFKRTINVRPEDSLWILNVSYEALETYLREMDFSGLSKKQGELLAEAVISSSYTIGPSYIRDRLEKAKIDLRIFSDLRNSA